MRFLLFALLVIALVSPIFATESSATKDNIGLKLFSFKIPTIKLPPIKLPPIKLPPVKLPPIKLPPVFRFPPIKLPPIIPFLQSPPLALCTVFALLVQTGDSRLVFPSIPTNDAPVTTVQTTPPASDYAPLETVRTEPGAPKPSPLAPKLIPFGFRPPLVKPPLPKPPQAKPVIKFPVPLRNPSKRSLSSCPDEKIACPVPGLLHGFDCVNIRTDLHHCGDCQVLGGVDCSQLPGTARVECIKGFCHVDSCLDGYLYDFRKQSCVQAPRFGFQ
ncbi:hypothetical protein JCM5353_007952 [Sporobolomyces roseus]